MTIKETIQSQSKRLKDVTHIPVKEVEILALHILQKNVIWLHLNYEKEFKEEKELEKLVTKRATNYPLEYLTQRVSFYGEIFSIEEGILIPRPETEILVEKTIKLIKGINNRPVRVLEIGIGSGVIGIILALLVENIEIIGVDINENAIKLATKNAKKHNVLNKISFKKSNLFENIIGDFDLVVSNPPYIANDYNLPSNVKFEPKNALLGGEIGDEILKQIIDETYKRKIPYLICEMGYDQKDKLSNFFKNYPIKSLEFYDDLAKLNRGFIAKF